MPKISKWNGYSFFVCSNENETLQDLRVNASMGKSVAQFRMFPEVRVSESVGFGRTELKTLFMFLSAFEGDMEKAWHEYYS
jgi:hypothetical protein